jgi:uncharacterized membrane protein
MDTHEHFFSNMHWGQFDFSMCFVFFIIMLLFMFLCSLFYRRKRWSWMWHNADCWKPTNTDNAENILKNRLAKGEINEAEYDNLLRKIRS